MPLYLNFCKMQRTPAMWHVGCSSYKRVLTFWCYPFGGTVMRETKIPLPELALIAGTRAALGAGLALLLADRLPDSQRRAVGWTLLLMGALTTIPLAFEVLGGGRQSLSSVK